METEYARLGVPMLEWKYRHNPDEKAASLPWTADSSGGITNTIYLAGHTFLLTNQIEWTTAEITIIGGHAATNAALSRTIMPSPVPQSPWLPRRSDPIQVP